MEINPMVCKNTNMNKQVIQTMVLFVVEIFAKH